MIDSKLRSVIEDADPLMPEQAGAQMQVQARQLGQAGIAAMAISAVDVALWDRKAKLLGVCLADALPRFRESVPIYGSGGFCNYGPEELRQQVEGWVEKGFRSVKIKVGRNGRADLERVKPVRSVVGHDIEVMVDANGANNPHDAVWWAERYSELGVTYFEEPVTSDDLVGLAYVRDHAPAGLAVAAGEYGWNLPYFQRMLDAGAVHILQADVTRCGGITNMAAGMAPARDIPKFAPLTLQQWWRERGGTQNPHGPRVVLWPDTFNNHFHTDVGVACVEAIEGAGAPCTSPR